MRKKIVVLTGAGVSAESGISTFRDSDGLWENFRVEDVSSIEGWYRDPAVVMDFYNQRRAQLSEVRPNAAHLAIADLEKEYDVTVVTQNVDNLHERAGSTKIIHHLEPADVGAVQARKIIRNKDYNFLTRCQNNEYTLDTHFQVVSAKKTL